MDLLPGWNSIEAAARLQHVFVKSSLVLLALLLVALVLAYVYGHRRDYLSDESDRVAQSTKRPSPALTDASTAQRREEKPAAALPQSPAPSITSSAPADASLPPAASGQISTPRQPVPLEKQEVTSAPKSSPYTAPEARQSAPATQAEEAVRPRQNDHAMRETAQSSQRHDQGDEAGHQAGLAMRKAGELRDPGGPRHLSREQKATLHAYLKNEPKGKLTIRINPAVADASNYGVEIAQFFKHETGWTVHIDNSPFTGADLGGMWIALRSPDAVPPATGTLHAALAHAQVPVHPQPVWGIGGPALNEIWLVIGKRTSG